jgi:hypothetical protein
MKRIARYTTILSCILLLNGCFIEEGNPNLAGSWTCKETSEIFLKSTKGTSIYQVTFTRDAVNQDKYYIENFYKLGSDVKVAVIKSGYTIELPKQSVNGFVFEGSGEVDDVFNTINLIYTADDGGGEIDHVTAEYTR